VKKGRVGTVFPEFILRRNNLISEKMLQPIINGHFENF